MTTTEFIHNRKLWTRLIIVLGGIGMLVGAVDPMEGSVVILIGSALVALGTFLSHTEHRLIVYRVWVFALIAMGVTAMWVLSNAGGIGGKSGLSIWWGLLILPYLAGWSMGIWGPGSPRWMLWLGIAVSLWYLWLSVMVQTHRKPEFNVAGVVIAALGLLTLVGCMCRLGALKH